MSFTLLENVCLTFCINPGAGLEFPVKLRVRIESVIGRIEGGGGDIITLGLAPVLTGTMTAGVSVLEERIGVFTEVTVVVTPN